MQIIRSVSGRVNFLAGNERVLWHEACGLGDCQIETDPWRISSKAIPDQPRDQILVVRQEPLCV